MNDTLDKLIKGTQLPGVAATVLVDGNVVYEGAGGVRVAGQPAPMTVDTVFAIFSMTKAITGAAAMQLVERGKLDLDKPASTYISAIGDIKVLDGFDADGHAKLRPPTNPITLRNLLAHTSGCAYELWNADLKKAQADLALPSIFSLEKAGLGAPLMFDPGTAWEYGTGIDWAGLLVEEVTGQTLGQYLSENFFGPMGMTSTGFVPTTAMAGRMASLHVRTPDGVVPMEIPPPAAPEFEMGGGGLFSTFGDYAKFAQMILDQGKSGSAQILSEATVAEMGRNQLGTVPIRDLPTATPLSHDLAIPGEKKGWGLTFLLDLVKSPQGRSAGSLSWAGLANTYYWIDPTKRVVGIWGTQLFPFYDPTVMAELSAFETGVYASLS